MSIFKTRNLKIASYLYASKVELFGYEKFEGDTYFKFLSSPRIKTLIDNYYVDRALVNPRDLFARLDDLRDIVYSSGKYENSDLAD